MARLATGGGTAAVAPPPSVAVDLSKPDWTECVLEGRSAGTTAHSFETWLFRTDLSKGFEKFLKHRHFDPSVGDSLSCRDRQPDTSIECLECARVVFGGVYGSIGVVVPAFPIEKQAGGCLSRSRMLEVDFDDDDNFDGNPTQEIAMCNSHRGKFEDVLA